MVCLLDTVASSSYAAEAPTTTSGSDGKLDLGDSYLDGGGGSLGSGRKDLDSGDGDLDCGSSIECPGLRKLDLGRTAPSR